MERTLKEALEHRRSYYALSSHSPVSDAEIEKIYGHENEAYNNMKNV